MGEKKKASCSKVTLIVLTNLIYLTANVFGQGTTQLEVFYTLPEESARNTPLGNIIVDASLRSLYSSDIVNSFTFGVLQSKYKENFNVNADNADFSSATPLDRETICPFKDQCHVTVDVAILKPVDYFRVIRIDIEIQDKNDIIPTFPKEKWVINVSESTLPGAAFVIPPAMDQDSTIHGIKSYFLEPQSDQFQLSVTFNNDQSQDIRLNLNKKLDREAVTGYNMVLKASDGGAPSNTGSMQIEINVVDHNDNSPIFDKDTYNITVAENYPPGMSIVSIHAMDWDDGLNGQVRYHLSTQSIQLFGDVFQVDQYTGDVILKSNLDYEHQELYTLLVEATDLGVGSLPALAKVIVNVQDVNDHQPVMTVSGLSTSGAVEISEKAKIGDPVAHISVEDLDKGISGEVTCESLDQNMGLTHLNGKRYKLVTNRLFDYELEKSYSSRILCKDKGDPQLTSSVDINISVIDENDNPPIFRDQSYSLSARENNTIGSVVLSVSASDKDSGNNGKLTYSLSEKVLDLLEISERGIIRAKVALDHEQMPVLQFNVIATDNGSPQLSASAPVTLTLLDINDESPRFSQPAYSFGTFENQPAGTEIGIVHAEDPDSYPNNEFTFSLDTQINGFRSFDVDPRTGRITTKKVLDREHIHTHVLKIWAVNTESPRPSSSVNVTVHVADKNDNAPRVIFPSKTNRTVQLPANAINGYVFTRIEATDSDLAENAKLKFSIAGGNSENLFEIDAVNGLLSVKGKLSRAEQKDYEVIIVVEDKGLEAKKAVAVLHVFINSSLAMIQPVGSFATASPEDLQSGPLISPNHTKILIVLGVVTTVLVIVLVSAIIYIKRRQMLQDRDLVQNVYKVEVCPTHDAADENAPLGDLHNDFKVKVEEPSSLNDSGCIDTSKTHLTLEDLKRMKCLYRDRPDITQHVPPTQRAGSPVVVQSPSYSVRPPGQPDAPYDGILDLLQRQPPANNQDNESTGSNTDSGRGTSEPGHDVSGGSGNRNSAEDFHPPNGGTRLGNVAPVHVYLKDKNTGGGSSNNNHGGRAASNRIPPPSYSDASQRPTHYTFQSPPQQKQPPTLPVRQPSSTTNNHQYPDNHKTAIVQPTAQKGTTNNHPYASINRGISGTNKNKRDNCKNIPSDDISESCDNVSLASTTSGEYVLQLDNGPFKSVNV